jgi:hypothetical protein
MMTSNDEVERSINGVRERKMRTWGSKLLEISFDITAAVTWARAEATGGEEQNVSKCVYCK